ncbi:DUF2975 domain-containing protein [Nocardia carnea]|uniref:DUF2975 domain-containing protein n=1 Tax=Nocardia carnea TaxID=37328 RepID=UPI0024585ABC|nr:DUF2975 domain-containing protein [Nocardia carnea]
MMGSDSGRLAGRRWTGVDAQWLTNLALIVAVAGLPVKYAFEGIFWPSVWVEKHATIEGMLVQQFEISLQDAEWIQRVEAATPGVLLVILVGWPGFLLLRRLMLDSVEVGDVFADDVVRLRESAARWCAFGSLMSVASFVMCNWLLGRSLGASVSLSNDMLFITLLLGMLGVVSSGLVRHGRRLRTELDQVI